MHSDGGQRPSWFHHCTAPYGPTTVHQWCRKGELYYIQSGGSYYIPKAVLIDFICSMRFRTIHRKSQWHIVTMMSFHKEMDAHTKQKEGK